MTDNEDLELKHFMESEYITKPLHQIIKYLRTIELESKGMGVLALVEMHNNQIIDVKMFDSILPAIENPKADYTLKYS